MNDVLAWILANKDGLLGAVGAFYVFATAVATVTPTGKDDTIVGKLGAFFDRVGLQLKTPKK